MQVANIAKIDSYKSGQFKQIRPGTRYVSNYIEARGSDRGWKEMVHLGAEYYIQEYFNKPLVTSRSLERMRKRTALHGISFNYEGMKYLLHQYDGFAPLRIQSLPEGMVVPVGTPTVQVVNTDPEAFFVPQYIETNTMRMWYPTSVATLSFHIKRTIKEFMLSTAGHIDGIDFMLHDFGPRGVSSSESAQIGGFGHLSVFLGTDNFEALEMIEEIYQEEMAGFSVDAAEHSTITSFGGADKELEAFTHHLKVLGLPGKIFSVVSDSYNIYDAVSEKWGKALKAEIEEIGRQGGRLVVRPDSGDPVTVVSEVIERLMDAFGYTVNDLGYRVLPAYLRVLQGDGINEVSIRNILQFMKDRGLSAENVVFGMGGALLQGVNRDTLKFAMKASGICHETEGWYDIGKDPITDKGKRSKKGRQAVIYAPEGNIITIRENDLGTAENLLQDVWQDGNQLIKTNLSQIRQRVNAAI